jgi:peptidoglycan/LPS O-acetylase OafA/YrhL
MNQYPYQQQPSQPQHQQPGYSQQPGVHSPGRRGLIVVIGAVVALFGFFLPYFSIYSGYQLASLYAVYWLDGGLAVAALLLLAARLFVPALETLKRRWALALMTLGVGGAFVHYWLVTHDSVLFYWGIGAWLYLLGMLAIALGGLLLFL